MAIFEIAAVRVTLSVLAGGGLGFAYQRLVGCKSGNCIITGNPYVATIYGAVLGLVFSLR